MFKRKKKKKKSTTSKSNRIERNENYFIFSIFNKTKCATSVGEIGLECVCVCVLVSACNWLLSGAWFYVNEGGKERSEIQKKV